MLSTLFRDPRVGVGWHRASVGSQVWGVLYELAEQDRGYLDDREGYRPDIDPTRNVSNRIAVTVGRVVDGVAVEAFTYCPTPSTVAGLPSSDYLFMMMRVGKELGFPEAYMSILSNLPRVASRG